MTAEMNPYTFHTSLNVADLDRSIDFYRVLFGIEPAKRKADYAKFELDQPPLILSLIPGHPSPGGALNHVGLRVPDAQILVEAQARLEASGIHTKREDGVECCYSKQTKFWVTDPDLTLWELYVFHEDMEEPGSGKPPQQLLPPTTITSNRTTWQHTIVEPVPERIPHPDNSLYEILLEGTANLAPETANLPALFREAYRALRPGAEIRVHGLSGDMTLTEPLPPLPGPAARVQHVPPSEGLAAALSEAGFVNVRFERLSEKAHFTIAGVRMREILLAAQKPGHRPGSKTHEAIYLGPLSGVTDDFGNVFPRGKRVALNVHDWQVLSAGTAAGQFLFLSNEPKR